MKVQCDVCGHEEALIFCCADEAALCDACDRKVHRANKLAEKHRRFALLRPASGDNSPNCDVCQERRGYIFCQEDRAILCKECDVPIHSANELTKKHNRFLLVGSRLSVQPVSYSVSDSTLPEEPNESLVDKNGNMKKGLVKRNQEKANLVDGHNPTMKATATTLTATVPMATAAASSGSSISEYLTKECPGWHVDDLFIDDAAAAAAAATVTGNQLTPFMESDFEGSGFDLPIWIPQGPQPPDYTKTTATTVSHFHTSMAGPKFAAPTINSGRDSWNDDLFTVPQISPREAVAPSKRARPSFWYY